MKIIFKKKVHGIWYHRVGSCCGHDKYYPRWWILLNFAFRKKFYWQCKTCGRIHGRILCWHTVPEYDTHVKSGNEIVEKNKQEVWKNG